MTPDERKMCDAFEWAVQQMGTVEHPTLADVEAIAFVACQVRGITSASRDVEELALHRLAYATENLLVWPGEQTVIREWLMARADLLQLRLSSC